MNSRTVHERNQFRETAWHSTQTKEGESIDEVTMKSLVLNSVGSVIITRLQTCSRYKRCK